MMGLGWQELVIVLIIIMIIFGAGKLPAVARSLGQGVKEFKEAAAVPGDTSTTLPTGTVDPGTQGAVAAAPEPVDVTAESAQAGPPRAAATTREAT